MTIITMITLNCGEEDYNRGCVSWTLIHRAWLRIYMSQMANPAVNVACKFSVCLRPNEQRAGHKMYRACSYSRQQKKFPEYFNPVDSPKSFESFFPQKSLASFLWQALSVRRRSPPPRPPAVQHLSLTRHVYCIRLPFTSPKPSEVTGTHMHYAMATHTVVTRPDPQASNCINTLPPGLGGKHGQISRTGNYQQAAKCKLKIGCIAILTAVAPSPCIAPCPTTT